MQQEDQPSAPSWPGESVEPETYAPLSSDVDTYPLTNATLTVRVIKSFEYRTFKGLVLKRVNLQEETVGSLMDRTKRGELCFHAADRSTGPYGGTLCEKEGMVASRARSGRCTRLSVSLLSTNCGRYQDSSGLQSLQESGTR
jgi:hypothetical protein